MQAFLIFHYRRLAATPLLVPRQILGAYIPNFGILNIPTLYSLYIFYLFITILTTLRLYILIR